MSKFGKFDRNSDRSARGASRPQAPLRKSGGGTLLGVFIGLVIGVLLSFGVVWLLNKSPLPFQNKYEGAPKEHAATPGGPATAPQTPAALPGKPGDKPTERQRFDFYNILEGKQPAAPAATAAPAPAPATAAPVVAAKPAPAEVLFLQVGSFQKAADADNLKAKLALTGLDAAVQEVNIPEKGTMHRVRVGPFRSSDEMDRARALLSHSGVQGTVIKQKE
jgi:cell division protein FtsN